MFTDPIECYEAIAKEICDIIPGSWERVIVDVTRYEASVNLKTLYTRPDGTTESDVDEIMLPDYFLELAHLVSSEGKGLYKRCIFQLRNDGTFNIEFEY